MGQFKHSYGRNCQAACARFIGVGWLAVLVGLASCAGPTKYSNNKTKQNSAHINNKTKFSSDLYGVKGSPRVSTAKKVRKGGGRYQVGKPYKIKNKWYYPKEQPGYNRVGMASWYGPNFHGRLTANGEVYDQYSLSAAHPTLPLPSYARVTNLENGSSVTVRINDRGPFSQKRIIDLSAQASKLLGYQKNGLAKVRVRYLGKARMDGLDAKYLMASYKPPKGQRLFPTFSPGATQPGTLLASATMPASNIGNGVTNTEPRAVVSSYSTASLTPNSPYQSLSTANAPVPILRPTPLYNGLFLNLATTQNSRIATLQPISFVRQLDFNERIIQAFEQIERLEQTVQR